MATKYDLLFCPPVGEYFDALQYAHDKDFPHFMRLRYGATSKPREVMVRILSIKAVICSGIDSFAYTGDEIDSSGEKIDDVNGVMGADGAFAWIVL